MWETGEIFAIIRSNKMSDVDDRSDVISWIQAIADAHFASMD
jgi:hypothetical protein